MVVQPTILQSDLVVQTILPFLLIFTIVFAVLQKSKILGDGKKQIDAIVAAVVGLIVISFVKAVGIILNLIPFLAVSVVVILVFLLLWGFFFKQGEFEVPSGVRIAMGVVAAIAVIIALIVVTPAKEWLAGLFTGNNTLVGNIIVIIILAAVIAAVLATSGSGNKENKKESKS